MAKLTVMKPTRRDTRAVDNAGEDVAKVAVDPHEMLRFFLRAAEQVNAGCVAPVDVFNADEVLVGLVGRNVRREDGSEDEDGENDEAKDGRTLPDQPAQGEPPQAVGAIVADITGSGIVEGDFANS